jgi:hypothetical protein
MNVSDLTGAKLDQWVARAEGKCYTTNPSEWGNALINDLGRLSIAKTSWDCARYFEPHKKWSDGGPIIERERIHIEFDVDEYSEPDSPWFAECGVFWDIGPTPLVAAMRAYVACRYGPEVPA